MKNTAQSSAQRLYWADVCRVVSIYGVVVLHSCGASFYQYGKILFFDWLQSVLLDSLVRCSVPLFVMLSGALILGSSPAAANNDGDLKQIFRRCLRILIPLVVWSLLYIAHLYRNGVKVNVVSILSTPAMYHLWFIYMMLGLYLLLPVLRALFASMRTSQPFFVYFFVAWFIITSLPVYLPLPVLALMQQNSLLGYGGYFLLGALLASRSHVPLSSLTWLAIFIVGVAITFGVTWSMSAKAGAPVETGFLYFSPKVVMASIAAFVLFSRIKTRNRGAKWLRYLGDCSFVVYFVHILVLEIVRYNPMLVAINQSAPLALSIMLISIATFAISLAISSLLKLVPGTARIFG
jgi:surface polysaccharide O-acyltransferase-like enzyme